MSKKDERILVVDDEENMVHFLTKLLRAEGFEVEGGVRLRREVSQLRQAVAQRFGFASLVGKSAKMQEVYTQIEKVAATRGAVLIQGESGTGKELVAKAIHFNSPRKSGPFVVIDCGAIPEALQESELFGHEKGAFTGAIATKKGLFEETHGGARSFWMRWRSWPPGSRPSSSAPARTGRSGAWGARRRSAWMPGLLPPPTATSRRRCGRGRSGKTSASFKETMARLIRDAEARLIRRALEQAGGNRTEAARILGISRRALLYKLNEYTLRRPWVPPPQPISRPPRLGGVAITYCASIRSIVGVPGA